VFCVDAPQLGTLRTVTSLILAFVIALTTGGLWVKTHSYVTQPHVRFKYDMVLVLEVGPDQQFQFHLRQDSPIHSRNEGLNRSR